jgi:uncharacterized protein involved in exopolysaccharide biosynthesis
MTEQISGSPADQAEPSTSEILVTSLRTLWRRRRLVVQTVVVIMAVTLVALLIVPARYISEADIVIEPQQQNIIAAVEDLSAPPRERGATENHVEIMRSRSLALKVIETLKLDQDPEFNSQLRWSAQLKNLAVFGGGDEPTNLKHAQGRIVEEFLLDLHAALLPRTSIMRVSYSASSPEKAFNIVEALVTHFLEEQVKSKLLVSGQAQQWIETRLGQLQQKLDGINQSIYDLQKAIGIGTREESDLITQQGFDVASRLALARSTRARLETQLRSVEQNLASWTPQNPALTGVVISPLVRSLREQERRAVAELEQLSSTLGEGDSRVANLETRIEELRNLIKAELESTVEILRNEAESTRASETALEQQHVELKQKLALIRENQFRLSALWSERNSVAGMYEDLESRFRVLESIENIQQPDARLISGASYPIEASFPRVYFTLALAFVVSLFAAAGIVYGVEIFGRTFRNAD